MTTYWNGLPTPATRGTAIVADAPDVPAHWAKSEGIVGDRIAVVCVVLDGVNYGNGVTYLDNRMGEGWRKVTEGRGSPRYGHKDVRVVSDSFIEERVTVPKYRASRGTSNTNERGSTDDRRARRAWIMHTYASDVAGFVRCYRCGELLYNPNNPPEGLAMIVLKPLTIDRIIAGCKGGTYRRNNIRPCCSHCNTATGGYIHNKSNGGWSHNGIEQEDTL